MRVSGTIAFIILLPAFFYSQVDSGLVANYSFDKGSPTEDLTGSLVKAYNVSLADDRFGNAQAAYYFHGIQGCYMNLGTSNKLKQKAGTISLWIYVNGIMRLGQGIESNPFIITRSHPEDQCNLAYFIGVDANTKQVNGSMSLNCLDAVSLYTPKEISIARWHHVALAFNDEFMALYLDGTLQFKTVKKFQNKYLEGDSVMVGSIFGTTNRRFFFGSIDDIRFYNRLLSDQEIMELYDAPNPFKSKILATWIAIAISALALIWLIIILVRIRIRSLVEMEKQRNKLLSNWHEQEIKVLSAQMDPHFIFNSLNAIQQFIVVRDNDMAELYLSKFSKLMRQILENNTKSSITLKDEIETCKKYLEMETLRFNNVFNYTFSIDPKLDPEKINIPHFLIQPLIENAIWHGLLAKSGDKNLSIIFEYLNDKTITCIVDDNGVGRSHLKSEPTLERRKSLALNFIQQRLQLISKMRGGDYSVSITDKLNPDGSSNGTKAIVTIPILDL